MWNSWYKVGKAFDRTVVVVGLIIVIDEVVAAAITVDGIVVDLIVARIIVEGQSPSEYTRKQSRDNCIL